MNQKHTITVDCTRMVQKAHELIQNTPYLDKSQWSDEKVLEWVKADVEWYTSDGFDADEHELIDSMLNWID